MKKLLILLFLISNVASAVSVFDDVIVENTLTLSAQLADRACVLDSLQKVTSSAVTSTELGYLSGVTSALQTQMDLKAPLASPALTGVPTAPTAATGTNTTQVATTAFVTDATSQPMPNVSSSALVTTTSASTTFVTALTTSITVTAASAPVEAVCVLDMLSATAVSVGSVVLTINGVSGGAVRESFTVLGTQRLTVSNQQLSAPLAAGTYTVNCDFNRISGTGTVTVNQGSLTATAMQGSRPATGVVTLPGGGTNNATLTAANGAVIYSTATNLDKTAVGSTGQVLRSAGAASPTWTAQTYPASTTINQLQYSSATNVVSGLATANTGALVTSSTGVPSITSGAVANRLLRTTGTAVTFAQANLTTDVTAILPGTNGGTGVTMFASGRIPYSNGTTHAADALFVYNAATNQFTVGNGAGTGKISSVVLATDPSPNLIAGNFYSRATTAGVAAVEAQNEGSLPTIEMTNSGGAIGTNILAKGSRGTLPSRTQAMSGDILFSLTSHGRGLSAWSTGYGATLHTVATENVTDTTNGTDWVFSTTPNGAAAVIERLRIKQDGVVNIGNLSASLPVKTNGSDDLISGAINLASAEVTNILPQANGGTGSATQNFVDLTTNQTAAGEKTFSGKVMVGTAVAAANAIVIFKDGHLKSTQTTAPVATVQANAGTGATCTIAQATDTSGQINVTTGTLGVGTGSYCQIAFNQSYNVAPICLLTPASSTLSTSVYVTSATTTMDLNFAVAGGLSSTYLINYHCIETQ